MTFRTLLVANRGEIARRVMRTAHAMGLRCVAVYTDADADAPFVDDADEAVRLPAGYLDIAGIVDAGRRTRSGAVHPGYGFLSENASFARAVLDAGLVWVGPPPAAVAAMGDKLAAKRLAVEVGVPTLASSEDPGDAAAVGYPLLVKAAAGGGGKGMRVVTGPDELDSAVASARREAATGFGDDTVFLERFVASSRHVEIQILGDDHGALVHLGERECSIQRRHQKLIEESPSPAVDDDLRRAMGDAALALARAIGYRSAGTVEFLIDEASKEFFFLEVNTRLQVEHPVTEEVTGIDLVREQLRLAAGEPLGYGQSDIAFTGHAIEARLCAEDPAAGFLPATGTLAAFAPAARPAVRWESGVRQGSVVTVEFDPLLAKVIAHAGTREEAARVLAAALERLHVGGVRTNRDFLAAVLRHREFLSGATTTDFIERCDPVRQFDPDDGQLEFAARAVVLWLQARERADAPVLGQVPSGWRNARLPAETIELRHGERTQAVTYEARRDGRFTFGECSGTVHAHTPASVDVEIGGRRLAAAVTRADGHLYFQLPEGTVEFTVVPRFAERRTDDAPGGLSAPMPGTVTQVRAVVGQAVAAGATLVVLEAMKMEHHITAPAAGTVTDVHVVAGQQVDNGAALLVFEPDDDGTRAGEGP